MVGGTFLQKKETGRRTPTASCFFRERVSYVITAALTPFLPQQAPSPPARKTKTVSPVGDTVVFPLSGHLPRKVRRRKMSKLSRSSDSDPVPLPQPYRSEEQWRTFVPDSAIFTAAAPWRNFTAFPFHPAQHVFQRPPCRTLSLYELVSSCYYFPPKKSSPFLLFSFPNEKILPPRVPLKFRFILLPFA